MHTDGETQEQFENTVHDIIEAIAETGCAKIEGEHYNIPQLLAKYCDDDYDVFLHGTMFPNDYASKQQAEIDLYECLKSAVECAVRLSKD